MNSIKKNAVINADNLSMEDYFMSLLKEGAACGVLSQGNTEDIQLQCIDLLAARCQRYNGIDSSSIRIEQAEQIMKSNLYTIGLYLKSLSSSDTAADKLKTEKISEMYQKGRKIIDSKLRTLRHVHLLACKNKVLTQNGTYNTTLEGGIKGFLRAYDPNYGAHEKVITMDYPTCRAVTNLAGVECLLQYTATIYLENKFCALFKTDAIKRLLNSSGDSSDDLVFNIFERVFLQAVGCVISGENLSELKISGQKTTVIQNSLSGGQEEKITQVTQQVFERLIKILEIGKGALLDYMKRCLPIITGNIRAAVQINNLSAVFVSAERHEKHEKILFHSGERMDDGLYRKILEEVKACRYSADKTAIIKQKIHTFSDLEDILTDAGFDEKETIDIFSFMGAAELAMLLKRHPYGTERYFDGQSQNENNISTYLHYFLKTLPCCSAKAVYDMSKNLEEI